MEIENLGELIEIVTAIKENKDFQESVNINLFKLRTILLNSKFPELEVILSTLINNKLIDYLTDISENECKNKASSLNTELIFSISETIFFFFNQLVFCNELFHLFILNKNGNLLLMNSINLIKLTHHNPAIKYVILAFSVVTKKLIQLGKKPPNDKIILGNLVFLFSLFQAFYSNQEILSFLIRTTFELIREKDILNLLNGKVQAIRDNSLYFLLESLFQLFFCKNLNKDLTFEIFSLTNFILHNEEKAPLYLRDKDIIGACLVFKHFKEKQIESFLGKILQKIVKISDFINLMEMNQTFYFLDKDEGAYLKIEYERNKNNIENIQSDLIYLLYLLLLHDSKTYAQEILTNGSLDFIVNLFNDEQKIKKIIIGGNIQYNCFFILCTTFNYIRFYYEQNPSENTKKDLLFKYLKVILIKAIKFFFDDSVVIKMVFRFASSLPRDLINDLFCELGVKEVEDTLSKLIQKYFMLPWVFEVIQKIEFKSLYKDAKVSKENIFVSNDIKLTCFKLSLFYSEEIPQDEEIVKFFNDYCSEDLIDGIFYDETFNEDKIKEMIIFIFAPLLNTTLFFKDNSILISPLLKLLSTLDGLTEERLDLLQKKEYIDAIANNIVYLYFKNDYFKDIFPKKEEITQFLILCLKYDCKNLEYLSILENSIKDETLFEIFLINDGLNILAKKFQKSIARPENLGHIFDLFQENLLKVAKNENAYTIDFLKYSELIENLIQIDCETNSSFYYLLFDVVFTIFETFYDSQKEKIGQAFEDSYFLPYLVSQMKLLYSKDYTIVQNKEDEKDSYFNKMIQIIVASSQNPGLVRYIISNEFMEFIENTLVYETRSNISNFIKSISDIFLNALKVKTFSKWVNVSRKFQNILASIKNFIINTEFFNENDILLLYPFFERVILLENKEVNMKERLITEVFLRQITKKFYIDQKNENYSSKADTKLLYKIPQLITLIKNSSSDSIKEENELSVDSFVQFNFMGDQNVVELKAVMSLLESSSSKNLKRMNSFVHSNSKIKMPIRRAKSLESHPQLLLFAKNIISRAGTLIKRATKKNNITEEESKSLSNFLYCMTFFIKKSETKEILFKNNIVDKLIQVINNELFTQAFQLKAYRIFISLLNKDEKRLSNALLNTESYLNFFCSQFDLVVRNCSREASLLYKNKLIFFTKVLSLFLKKKNFYLNNWHKILGIAEIAKSLFIISEETEIVLNIMTILQHIICLNKETPNENNKNYEADLGDALINGLYKKQRSSIEILFKILEIIEIEIKNVIFIRCISEMNLFYSFFQSVIFNAIFHFRTQRKLFPFLNSLVLYPKVVKQILLSTKNEMYNLLNNNIKNSSLLKDFLNFLLSTSNVNVEFFSVFSEINVVKIFVEILSYYANIDKNYNGVLTEKTLKLIAKMLLKEKELKFFSSKNGLHCLESVFNSSLERNEIVCMLLDIFITLFESKEKEEIMKEEKNSLDLKNILVCLISKNTHKKNIEILKKTSSLIQLYCDILEKISVNEDFIEVISINIGDELKESTEVKEVLLNLALMILCLDKTILDSKLEIILSIVTKFNFWTEKTEKNISVLSLLLSIIEIITSEPVEKWSNYYNEIAELVLSFKRSYSLDKGEILNRIIMIIGNLSKLENNVTNSELLFTVIEYYKCNTDRKDLLESINEISENIIVGQDSIMKYSEVLYDLSLTFYKAKKFDNLKILFELCVNISLKNDNIKNSLKKAPTNLYEAAENWKSSLEKSSENEGLIESIDEFLLMFSGNYCRSYRYTRSLSSEVKDFLTTKHQVKISYSEESKKYLFQAEKDLSGMCFYTANNQMVKRITFDEVEEVVTGSKFFKRRSGLFGSKIHDQKCFSIILKEEKEIINLKAKDETARDQLVENLNKVLEARNKSGNI